nr:glutamate receptor 2.1 [Quercus suber]
MEMAIKDVFDKTNQRFDLHIKNTHSEPVQATLAAWDLIRNQQVQAILGPHTWEEASLVAEIGNNAQIPVLSFADTTPQWATKKWPFLLQASPNQNAQMKAIAAIIQSWEWHQVTVIYEDNDSLLSEVIPHLSDALLEFGAEISHTVALSPYASSSSLSIELERLKGKQHRVFVVHLSLTLAVRLFERAKEMNMMEKDYVWITTEPFTSFIHSLSASSISSMQGIIGVKSYFPQNHPHFQNFYARFRQNFSLENPEEDKNEPGIFAAQAFDAVQTVCLAMMRSSKGSQPLLDNIMLSEYNGLNGKVQFIDKKVTPAHIFQIINVFGKSYKELGFWSKRKGFSVTTDERTANNTSMRSLEKVYWPGGTWTAPRGWTLPTNANPLRIGVPTKSSFKQFVSVVQDQSKNSTAYEGFAIDLFQATVGSLPYYLPYNFTPFDGTYDEIVEQKFDAVVGDVAIVAKRFQHAAFTQPYTESGLVMIVPVRIRPQTTNRGLLFMKPFTKAMWALIGAIIVYNGFVVWLIERNHNPELKGSALNQIGALLCLAFTSLFSLHVQKLEASVNDVESLQYGNAVVGCCRGSFVAKYLVDVLRFHKGNIRTYNSPEEYAHALRSKEIAAAFLEVPFAKLFLAKYCKEFITAGPTYKDGGFSYVFPRGSLLLHDVNKAILNVSESGRLRELEKSMVASEKCVDYVESIDEVSSLSPTTFSVLFMLTGGTSTVALMVYVVFYKLFGHKTIWRRLGVMRNRWTFSPRLSDM